MRLRLPAALERRDLNAFHLASLACALAGAAAALLDHWGLLPGTVVQRGVLLYVLLTMAMQFYVGADNLRGLKRLGRLIEVLHQELVGKLSGKGAKDWARGKRES